MPNSWRASLRGSPIAATTRPSANPASMIDTCVRDGERRKPEQDDEADAQLEGEPVLLGVLVQTLAHAATGRRLEAPGTATPRTPRWPARRAPRVGARCGVDHQGQQHDARRVGDGDLRGDRQDRRPRQPERVDDRAGPARPTTMPSAPRRARRGRCRNAAARPTPRTAATAPTSTARSSAFGSAPRNVRVAHGHVGADDEHHQREADVGQQRERRIAMRRRSRNRFCRTTIPATSSPTTDGDAEAGHRGQQRAGQCR